VNRGQQASVRRRWREEEEEEEGVRKRRDEAVTTQQQHHHYEQRRRDSGLADKQNTVGRRRQRVGTALRWVERQPMGAGTWHVLCLVHPLRRALSARSGFGPTGLPSSPVSGCIPLPGSVGDTRGIPDRGVEAWQGAVQVTARWAWCGVVWASKGSTG
jgi:hypothetical protein